MPYRKRSQSLLLFVGVLAGAAFPAAAAPGPFDGTYRGPLTATEAIGRTCHNTASVVRMVKDNMLSFKWTTSQITLPVAPDGTISVERPDGSGQRGRGGSLRISGRIADKLMILDTEGGGCGFHFEGRKVP